VNAREQDFAEMEVRAAVGADLRHLLAMNHTIESDQVWQLDLRRAAGQVTATFREARLPRPTRVQYPHDPSRLSEEWSRKDQIFTAVLGGDRLGYITLMDVTPSVVRVSDIVVDALYRRRGVGRGLLAAAHSWALARKRRFLVLEVQSKNFPAIRMAQKCGFEFSGYNDHYYSTQDVALFFVKTIPHGE